MLTALAHAQTQFTYKTHVIGETTQQFFSIAQMAGHDGQLSADFCKSFLANPQNLEKYKQSPHDTGSLVTAVRGCREVQDAVDGWDTEVGSHYAYELGGAIASFRAGKLVAIHSTEKTKYGDVVSQITKKFGYAGKIPEDSLPPTTAWPTDRTAWVTDRIAVIVSDLQNGSTAVDIIDRTYKGSLPRIVTVRGVLLTCPPFLVQR